MKQWKFWFAFAVNSILMALQVALQDEESREDMKSSCFDIYYAIQRAYPELMVNKNA